MAGVSPAQNNAFDSLSCRAATVTLPLTGATVNVKACAPVASTPTRLAALPPVGMRAIGEAVALRRPGPGGGVNIRERAEDRRRASAPVAADRRVTERRTAGAEPEAAVPVVIAGDVDTSKTINAAVEAAASARAASLLAAGGAATITVPNDGNTEAAVAKWIQDTRLTQPDAERALAVINSARLRRDASAQPFTMEQVASALAVAALAMNGTEVDGPDLTVTIPNEATFNALVRDALTKAAREGRLGMPVSDAVDIIAALNVSAQRANGLTTAAQLEAAEDAAVQRLADHQYVGADGIVVTPEHYRRHHRRGETSRRGLAVLEAAQFEPLESGAVSSFTGFASGLNGGDHAQATATQRRAVAMASERQAQLRRTQQRDDEQVDSRQAVAAVVEHRIDRERGEMSDAVASDDGSPETRARVARLVSA